MYGLGLNDLIWVDDIYQTPNTRDKTGTYKVKVHIYEFEQYLPYHFVLFDAEKGEYELYPASILSKHTNKYEDRFEQNKYTPFYFILLNRVIEAVEDKMSITITRKEDELDSEVLEEIDGLSSDKLPEFMELYRTGASIDDIHSHFWGY